MTEICDLYQITLTKQLTNHLFSYTSIYNVPKIFRSWPLHVSQILLLSVVSSFVCMLYICMGTYVWNPGKFFSSNLPYAFSTLVWGQCLSLKLEPDKNSRAASPRDALTSVSSELKYQHTSLTQFFKKLLLHACIYVCIYACMYLGCVGGRDHVYCMADMWRSEENLQQHIRFSYQLGSRGQTQAVSNGSKNLYPLGHLIA